MIYTLFAKNLAVQTIIPWVPNKIIWDNVLICVTEDTLKWAFWGIPLVGNQVDQQISDKQQLLMRESIHD